MKGSNTVVIKSFRISSKIDDIFREVCTELSFRKTDLIRILLTRSAHELRSAGIKVGGYENLSFGLEEFNGNPISAPKLRKKNEK